ncbi:hypothetical protein SAMN05661096_02085 [Marivirga sericea]|uniref:histidine kinase n=1 Tax=Marivirga sericea TaxID=1028 RepID=A0A1X7JZT2_9BACT|nr:hypothetical protein [Marivirga sericea]SMG33305.1 hypothetical protein SAMN05661096_02085 [Marivirga sericea]
MSLPKTFDNPYFQPRHQILHEKMNPVLKMLCELSQASQSFLILWEDDYHQLYDLEKEAHFHLNIDHQIFSVRFSKLNQEVIYVPNLKFHTLFQNISFFKSYTDNEQLLIYPILDRNNKVKGIAGIVLTQVIDSAFDQLMKHMDSIGTYLNHLYLDFFDSQRRELPGYLNMENLPTSFFEFEVDADQELHYNHFSKNLIRKHPGFSNDCSAEKRVANVLSMPIADFYSLIQKIRDNQSMEYVYSCSNNLGEKKYFIVRLHISRVQEGRYRCLGVLEDFTIQKAYGSVLDQMIFDISHVMRRPVVTMKGLTNLIDIDKFEKDDLRHIAEKIKSVSEEMEEYIRAMFKIYEAKQEAIYHL